MFPRTTPAPQRAQKDEAVEGPSEQRSTKPMYERFNELVRKAYTWLQSEEAPTEAQPRPTRSREAKAATGILILNLILATLGITNEGLKLVNGPDDASPTPEVRVEHRGGVRIDGGGIYVEKGNVYVVKENQADRKDQANVRDQGDHEDQAK